MSCMKGNFHVRFLEGGGRAGNSPPPLGKCLTNGAKDELYSGLQYTDQPM